MKHTALIALATSFAIAANAKTIHESRGLSAFPAHKIPASGALSREDLVALAKMGDVPSDPFIAPPANTYTGRHFVLTFPFSGEDAFVPFSWEYSLENQLFKIKFDGNYGVVNGISLLKVSRSNGSYIGQNAFGVKVHVASVRATDIVLYLVSTPPHEKVTDLYPFVSIFKATPDEARQISRNIEIILNGFIAKNYENKIASCSDNHRKATIDDPTDIVVHTCTVNANVTQIVIRNSVSGVVYKQWGTPFSESAVEGPKMGR